MTPEIAFAPLPVRRRGTLEVLDTALKLYRRYFGVLMGWSLLVAASWLLSIFVPMAYLLTFPLVYGSVACCVAAAVRGQKVAFGQVWDFTKPRYGALIGLFLLSLLILAGVALVVVIAATLLFFAGAYLLANAPEALQITVAVIAYIVALVVYSVGAMAATIWQSVVLFVVCLEDDKRGTAALGRAWQLLQGRWKSTLGLATLLGLSVMVVFGIIFGMLGLFGGLTDIFSSNASEWAIFSLMAGAGGVMGLFFLFWMPAQYMVTAVLYLDLRVRKEALDIEWTAYASGGTALPQEAAPQAVGPVVPMNTSAVAPEAMSAHATATPSSFGATPGATPDQLVTPPLVPPPGSNPSAPPVSVQVPPPPVQPPYTPPAVAPAPPPAPAATSSFAPPPSANASSFETVPNPFSNSSPTESANFGSMPPATTSDTATGFEPSFGGSAFGGSSFGSVPSEPTIAPNAESPAFAFETPPPTIPPSSTDTSTSPPTDSSPPAPSSSP